MIGLGNAQIFSDRAGAGGGTGGAPTDATYIVVSLNATLTAERTLAAESGVLTTSDAGAGNNFTIGVATQGIGTPKIADRAVTYVKVQDVQSKRLLGRFATTSGSPQEITIGTNLTLTSDGALDAAAGSITLSTGQRLLGRFATTSGSSQEITVSGGLSLSTDGTLGLAQMPALTVKANSATGSANPLNATMAALNRMMAEKRRNSLHVFTDCFSDPASSTMRGSEWEAARIGIGTIDGQGTGPDSIQHPGILIIRSGTTASDGAYIATQTGGYRSLAGGERYELMFKQHVFAGSGEAGPGSRLYAGFADLSANAPPNEGAYFVLSPTGGLFGETALAAVRTTTPLIANLATGTWYRGLIEVNSVATTGVVFTAYNDSGTQLGQQTATANIPDGSTATMHARMFVRETRNASGVIDLASVDYITSWREGLTRGGT